MIAAPFAGADALPRDRHLNPAHPPISRHGGAPALLEPLGADGDPRVQDRTAGERPVPAWRALKRMGTGPPRASGPVTVRRSGRRGWIAP